MPTVTLNIPKDRYSAFLRLAADYLDGTQSEDPGHQPAEAKDTPGIVAWRIRVHDLNDEDFQLLVEYLGKLRGLSAAVFDYLAEHEGPVDGHTLARWLGVDSRRAVAGSLGHAARFANELGRVFPIKWDRDSGAYWLDNEMREAVRQARIWTVPAPYDYILEIDGKHLRYRSDDLPARYALFDAEPAPEGEQRLIGFFHDQEAVVRHHADAMHADATDYGYLRIEFTPDAVHRHHLIPLQTADGLGFRQEQAHDLVTFPVTDGFTMVEVQH
jgi:hypothetical protein